MKATKAARQQDKAKAVVMYMAAELSAKTWVFGFSDGSHDRVVTVKAWDQMAVGTAIAAAARKSGLPRDVRVLGVQEAGRDAFSVHRYFESLGVESVVVDPASIEVPRRARRAKTDRLDAGRLLRLLMRWAGGEKQALTVLHVPSPEVEDRRRLLRERDRLVGERTRETNRAKSLLATVGLKVSKLPAKWPELLPAFRTWDNAPLPRNLLRELERLAARWRLLNEQLAAVNAELKATRSSVAQRLEGLKGIGPVAAETLDREFLWRDFHNRREVGGASGMTGTPFNSGDSQRDQGISKAGNARIRHVMIEATWLWVRYQPDSEVTLWWRKYCGGGPGHLRRKGIVGAARRLLIALWRYAAFGELPAGARLSAA